MLALGGLSAALPTASASGQLPLVSPLRFEYAEGTLGLSNGLGTEMPKSRFLQLIKRNRPKTVTSISVRRDGVSSRTYPSFAVVADMYVSSHEGSEFRPRPVFDENHGPDKTQVADVGVFVFPETNPGPVPHPFVYRFPFETPFQLPKKTSVCWEVITHYHTTRERIAFDAAGNAHPNPQPVVNPYGMGCVATGETAPVTLKGSGAALFLRRTEFDYFGSRLPPNSPAVLAIGTSGVSFGGVRLPLQLPGSEWLTSGPCTIYHNFVAAMPVQADAAGSFTQHFTVHFGFSYINGLSVFGQVVVPDSGSPLGLVLSNGIQHQVIEPIPKPLPIGHAYLNGSTGAVGNVVLEEGLIARVE